MYSSKNVANFTPSMINYSQYTEINQTQTLIAQVCDSIKELVLQKNIKYGDSALDPVRIFSSASNIEQILVRIDDKLSRIKESSSLEDEDVINDLIGYLVLYKVALIKEKND